MRRGNRCRMRGIWRRYIYIWIFLRRLWLRAGCYSGYKMNHTGAMQHIWENISVSDSVVWCFYLFFKTLPVHVCHRCVLYSTLNYFNTLKRHNNLIQWNDSTELYRFLFWNFIIFVFIFSVHFDFFSVLTQYKLRISSVLAHRLFHRSLKTNYLSFSLYTLEPNFLLSS